MVGFVFLLVLLQVSAVVRESPLEQPRLSGFSAAAADVADSSSLKLACPQKEQVIPCCRIWGGIPF
jgi:hypothetical protein